MEGRTCSESGSPPGRLTAGRETSFAAGSAWSTRWARARSPADPGKPTVRPAPRIPVPVGPETPPPPLRPWQRLSVRLAAFFAAITFLAVGAVGVLTYTRQQREVEDSVGTQLLNIARVAALDRRLRAAGHASRSPAAAVDQELRQALGPI